MSEETFSTNIGGCNPSDCASCTSNCSSAGGASIPRVPNPTIKLTLDDDSILECAVLTTFDVEGFGEYIALVPLDKKGKNTTGETYLFRYAQENGNPVITNIEREDEYMAAAQSFHDFIANLPSDKDAEESTALTGGNVFDKNRDLGQSCPSFPSGNL